MEERQQEKREPLVTQSFNGWDAHGNGWAVHGATKEEALENYWKAEQRRREILAMLPWYKQVEEQARREEMQSVE